MKFVEKSSGTEFEIPEDWFSAAASHVATPGDAKLAVGMAVSVAEIAAPVRNNGQPGFVRDRMISVLSAMMRGIPIPPIQVEISDLGGRRYRVRDGMHRYYAAIALGHSSISVEIVPAL